MKHFKTIETKSDYPDVLIFRDRDLDGNETVIIMAWGIQDVVDNICAEEEIVFPNHHAAIDFISAFGVEQAQNFCERNNLKYW